MDSTSVPLQLGSGVYRMRPTAADKAAGEPSNTAVRNPVPAACTGSNADPSASVASTTCTPASDLHTSVPCCTDTDSRTTPWADSSASTSATAAPTRCTAASSRPGDAGDGTVTVGASFTASTSNGTVTDASGVEAGAVAAAGDESPHTDTVTTGCSPARAYVASLVSGAGDTPTAANAALTSCTWPRSVTEEGDAATTSTATPDDATSATSTVAGPAVTTLTTTVASPASASVTVNSAKSTVVSSVALNAAGAVPTSAGCGAWATCSVTDAVAACAPPAPVKPKSVACSVTATERSWHAREHADGSPPGAHVGTYTSVASAAFTVSTAPRNTCVAAAPAAPRPPWVKYRLPLSWCSGVVNTRGAGTAGSSVSVNTPGGHVDASPSAAATDRVTSMTAPHVSAASTSATAAPGNGTAAASDTSAPAGGSANVTVGASFTAATVTAMVATSMPVPPNPELPLSFAKMVTVSKPL